MHTIKKVAILGGDGTMGSQSGGIFAQAGISCIFFSPSIESAQKGIENAVKQARSDVIREYIVPKTFDQLEKELPECDWIFEALIEDLEVKRAFLHRVDNLHTPGSIISTITSSLSIEELVENCSREFKSHFVGVHFFNPPGKLLANELIFHPDTTEEVKSFVFDFCEKVLRRVNIVTYNTPGFAGNRIGFQLVNEAAIYAEKYGVEKIDYLLGPYTGRALPPLATIDLVGLDVYKEIVSNIAEHVKDERPGIFKIPGYVQKMIDKKMLGIKSGGVGGFYRYTDKNEKLAIEPLSLHFKETEHFVDELIEQIKLHLHDGDYRKAIDLIKNEQSDKMKLVRHFILGYISYSYSRIGEVTPPETGIYGIDRVMSYGFSWLPPSAWVDFLGGPRETIKLIEKSDLPVPEQLKNLPEGKQCRIPEVKKYFIAL